jgi:hypothetical protein
MKTLEERQKIYSKLIGEFYYSDDNSEIIIWDEIIEDYIDGDEEIKTKIYNTLKLVNEARNESPEAFEIFLDREIETDLWYNT